jgi:hypothetical protein
VKSKSLHSAKYIVKIFQVFLFRLTGHDHIIEYTLDTSGVDVTAGPLARFWKLLNYEVLVPSIYFCQYSFNVR